MKIIKNKIVKFLFVLFFMFSALGIVSATTGIMHRTDYRIYFDGNSIVQKPQEEGKPENSMFYKYSDTNASYLCTNGIYVDSIVGEACSAKSINTKKLIEMAYIINSMTGVDGGVANLSKQETKYYWMEIAILKYLDNDDKMTLTDSVINTQIKNVSSSKQTLTQMLSNANSYYTKYSKTIDLNLSENKLDFKLNGDYYYSQKVYIQDVNSNSDTISITVDNKNFELIESSDSKGKYFQLKINKNDVLTKKQSVNVNVTAKNTFYYAKFYDCSGDYQDLIATTTTKKSNSDSVKISGLLAATKLVINKVDKDGNFVEGVKLKIQNTEANYENIITTKKVVLF